MANAHAAPADRAMGLELEAIDLESALEWAEAQGRATDAGALRVELVAVLEELGRVADTIPARVAA
jgi:hypothetical protein